MPDAALVTAATLLPVLSPWVSTLLRAAQRPPQYSNPTRGCRGQRTAQRLAAFSAASILLGLRHCVSSSCELSRGILAETDEPMSGIEAFTANRRMLVVLDSCERMVAAIAALIEAIL